MAKSTKEDVRERLKFTSDVMLRVRGRGNVVDAVRKKYGVDPRTVDKWMSKVREQRREYYDAFTRDEHRDDMRETLNTVYQMAINKRKVLRNNHGPIIDPATGEPITVPDPDLGAAVSALRELKHLDGLDEPIQTKLKIEGDVALIPDLKAVGAAVADAMKQLVAAVASKRSDLVAGEQFKLAGGELPDMREYEEAELVDDAS